MLRALALTTVRKKQDEPRGLIPFAFVCNQELIDDDHGTVDEVTELGFPADQRVRVRDRIAVLEAHRRVLGEQRIVDPELALIWTEMAERCVFGPRVVIGENSMSLRKRSAARILARDADRRALEKEGTECKRLSGGPVDLAIVVELRAALELALELRMDREIFRHSRFHGEDVIEPSAIDTGFDR